MSSIQFGSGLRPVEPHLTQEESASKSRALLVARLAQNGFVSADLRAQFGLSAESLEAGRVRLLGGVRLFQKEIDLKPDETFAIETSRERGRKVHVACTEGRPQVTVTFKEAGAHEPERVLHSGPFNGVQNFASGMPYGHFRLTIKNNTKADIKVYVHVEDQDYASGLEGCALQ